VTVTAGPDTGFHALEQSIVDLAPGGSTTRATGGAEEVLFVVSGEAVLRVAGGGHRLQTESGAYLAPGERYELENPGSDQVRVISVRIPDPGDPPTKRFATSRLEDQDSHAATAERWFRIVADPDSGLRSATHFVGYIPTEKAPDHFHTYDEVIYILEGEGVFHAGGEDRPLAPGSCIQLPARTVHCLENTGPGTMRLVAVLRPAGSPAAAYYPDGTPAYLSAPQP
jgi:mannose-6-phosphate isomerase-like protein (cupin superfamily)